MMGVQDDDGCGRAQGQMFGFTACHTRAQAFTRRERCTALIASIKASVVALYWMHRDWCVVLFCS